MFFTQLRARLTLALVLGSSLVGCAKTPTVDSRLDGVEGKPFTDPSTGGYSGDGGPSACGILSCRYTAVGTPACADYYMEEGWTPEEVEKDCKAAAAAVQTTTIDAKPQPACIQVGAALDGKVGGQCAIKGALAEFKSRNVYAYGMTEGLCTGIKDLEGKWNEVPFNPCPDEPVGGGGGGGSSGEGGAPAPDSDIFNCRHTEGLLAAPRCTDFPSVYGWDEAKAKSACDELMGMFSADKAQACIDGGFEKRCGKPDQSYVYGVDSCDGLFGVLEILGAAQPPEAGPFPPYSAVSCGNDMPAESVFTCRYDGFAASCADYPTSEGWSAQSAEAHCKLLPNSKNHKMGGASCLEDSNAKSDSTRCKIADPTVCDQVYYGYDIPDFVCTGDLIAGETEYQKAPYSDSY